MSWCEQQLPERENVDMEDDYESYILLMIDLFNHINMVVESDDDGMT